MSGDPFALEGGRLVTYRLTVGRFRELLEIILGPDAPDDLANRVLMACTRPRDGVISVPLDDVEARRLYAVVDAAGGLVEDLATVLRAQLDSA